MKNSNLNYLALGALIGGILIWLGATISVKSNNQRMMSMMGINPRSTSQETQRNSVIDAHFIEQMTPHHDDAIVMAKIALRRAGSLEIKTLAENIIESQTKENKQMRAWYKEWFGRELPTGDDVMQTHGMGSGSGMHMGMMGDETDLKALETSEDFDREFVKQMIPHHQMAVMMASMLRNGTQRNEMKDLADNIITAQTREIEQMRAFLKNIE